MRDCSKSATSSRSDAGYSSHVSSREQTPPIEHALSTESTTVTPIGPPSTSPFHRDNRVAYPITIQQQLHLMDTAAEEVCSPLVAHPDIQACMRKVTAMLDGLSTDYAAAVEWQATNAALVARVAEYRVLLAAQEYADTIDEAVYVDDRMNVTVAQIQ